MVMSLSESVAMQLYLPMRLFCKSAFRVHVHVHNHMSMYIYVHALYMYMCSVFNQIQARMLDSCEGWSEMVRLVQPEGWDAEQARGLYGAH